jgi:hypothetical protein
MRKGLSRRGSAGTHGDATSADFRKRKSAAKTELARGASAGGGSARRSVEGAAGTAGCPAERRRPQAIASPTLPNEGQEGRDRGVARLEQPQAFTQADQESRRRQPLSARLVGDGTENVKGRIQVARQCAVAVYALGHLMPSTRGAYCPLANGGIGQASHCAAPSLRRYFHGAWAPLRTNHHRAPARRACPLAFSAAPHLLIFCDLCRTFRNPRSPCEDASTAWCPRFCQW